MKGKISIIISLIFSVLFLFIFVDNSKAYTLSSQSLYNFQSPYNFFQNGSWADWREGIDNREVSLGWIQEQIEAVLDQLGEMGFTLPIEVELYLKEAIQNAFDKLINNRMLIPYISSEFFGKPDYNFSWNYDVMTRNINFSADNFFSSENMSVLVGFDGDFSADEEAPWNVGFSIQSTSFNRQKTSFNQEEDKGIRTSLIKRRRSSFQTRLPSRLGLFSWELVLQGEVCQDGLVYLHINPRQITTLNLWNTTYITKSGVEILQDSSTQEGKFYLDVIQDKGEGDQKQLYYWESPLWQ